MSPRRWNVCPDCDGSRKGPTGDVCYECQGLGGSYFGENRPLKDIEADIEKTREIMAQDEAEKKRAQLEIVRARPEMIGGYQKQIAHLNEALAYWQDQFDGLATERAAAIKREGARDAIQP